MMPFAQGGWTGIPCDPVYGGQGAPKSIHGLGRGMDRFHQPWPFGNVSRPVNWAPNAGLAQLLFWDALKRRISCPKMV